jgi:holo-[acyl-carrier protein] synthase
MIIGTGIDIVEVYRMREAIDKWGQEFLSKIFTPREMSYSNSRRFSSQHFAGKFAAKEACLKAFGLPRRHPLQWTQIEILNDREGRPKVEFHADALKMKKHCGVDEVVISLSHSKNYAVANAILLTNKKR